MAIIRPFSPPVVTPQSPASSAQAPVHARGAAEARAAQRAFFQQALGDATPVRAAPAAAAVAQVSALQAPRATQSAGVIRPVPDAPPARPMRPGSFIDIKV
jgi:hypothetical protein